MYIFRLFTHPTQSEQWKESICLPLYLRKVLTDGRRDGGRSAKLTVAQPNSTMTRSCLCSRFWLRNLVGAGEKGTKVFAVHRRALLLVLFPLNFPGPPPDVYLSDILPPVIQ